jgi:hypothetical protein
MKRGKGAALKRLLDSFCRQDQIVRDHMASAKG